MIVPLPSPEILFDHVDDFLQEFTDIEEVASGVASIGDAASYALVWEWGNARQRQIGPKTTLGINPDGKRVFLSIQAPHGYIRVNEPLYWAALEEEIDAMEFTGGSSAAIRREMGQAAKRAAKRVQEIIQEHVPVDHGDLHDSIKVVNPGDELLEQAEEDNAVDVDSEDIEDE